MKTHATLNAARGAAKINGCTQFILEIDTPEGRCFIGARVGIAAMRAALAAQPMAEITALVAEHEARPATLEDQRGELNLRLLESASLDYDGGEFALRGSAKRYAVAKKALADFDSDHPEVLQAILEEAAATTAAARSEYDY